MIDVYLSHRCFIDVPLSLKSMPSSLPLSASMAPQWFPGLVGNVYVAEGEGSIDRQGRGPVEGREDTGQEN